MQMTVFTVWEGMGFVAKSRVMIELPYRVWEPAQMDIDLYYSFISPLAKLPNYRCLFEMRCLLRVISAYLSMMVENKFRADQFKDC